MLFYIINAKNTEEKNMCSQIKKLLWLTGQNQSKPIKSLSKWAKQINLNIVSYMQIKGRIKENWSN